MAASNRGLFTLRMRINPIFEKAFSRLYGKPCWGIETDLGLSFEFGQPHLQIREPREASWRMSRKVRVHLARRHVLVKGDWHLIIWLCDWEVFQKRRRLGSNRSRSGLDRAVRSLEGQKLARFSMDARGNDCVFTFDLGGLLRTHSSGPDMQWQLFEPLGRVLTLRGDRTYSYTRSDRSQDDDRWRSVFALEG